MGNVETKNANYQAYQSKWSKMRDIFSGQEVLQANAKRYIPMLSGQTEEQYREVINRESVENYTNKTAQGITGLIFAKTPQVEIGSKIQLIKNNIDLSKSSIIDLAQTTVNEVTAVGRCGLLVDMQSYNTQGMSVAEVERLNLRPYIKLCRTENIINWRYKLINNQNELSLLVLQEQYEEYKNEFKKEFKVRFRVYSLDENGFCKVRLMNEDDELLEPEIYPMMNGKNLDFIPFIPINAEDVSIEPVNPPLLDIANINLSHWYLSVERRNALHYVGFPSIYGTGIQKREDDEIKLGAGTINIFDNPQAKLDFLQLSADGMGSVEKALEEKKQAMLALGARLLAPESSSQISENTMQMKTAGSRAVIIQLADTISRGIEKALTIIAMWLNDSGNIIFKLNTDYNLSEMSPQMMTALFTGQQLGQIRKEDVFNALKKGDIIDDNVTFEEWSGDLETQSPLDSVSIPTRTANARTNTTTN